MDKIRTLDLDDIFLFACRKELACFNRCCRDINLFLTPYDIMRLKNRLSLPSREFLDTYTTAIYLEEIGHPLVVMKMLGKEKRCPFSTPKGCCVYTDRPWSCRIFPLEPVTNNNTSKPVTAYSIIKRPFCLGFTEGTPLTIRKWLETQGTAKYEEMNALWAKVTLSKDFPAHGLNQEETQMFFLASYSLDEFSQLVSRPSFLENYSLKRQEIEPVLRDEILLYSFACRWLRLTLLAEEISLIP